MNWGRHLPLMATVPWLGVNLGHTLPIREGKNFVFPQPSPNESISQFYFLIVFPSFDQEDWPQTGQVRGGSCLAVRAPLRSVPHSFPLQIRHCAIMESGVFFLSSCSYHCIPDKQLIVVLYQSWIIYAVPSCYGYWGIMDLKSGFYSHHNTLLPQVSFL